VGDVVRDYNETFRRKSPGLVDAATLKRQVSEQGLGGFRRVVVLAGSQYALRVRTAFEGTGAIIDEPMKGLSLGKRLRWLNNPVPPE
jgi:uncharacterized protein DUF6884